MSWPGTEAKSPVTHLTELDVDASDVSVVTNRREEVLAAVRDHAGGIAYNVARIEGGDYGRRAFSTDRGEWTVKYEAGELEFLLYEPRGGGKTYVISMQSPAAPEPLARALEDYGAFVAAYNDYVASLEGVLDAVNADFPAVESAESVAAERDRVVDRIESCCGRVAGELHRHEGTEYGTFTARVDGTRWELKREADAVSYLRVGGSGGVYLLSQYGPPAATDVREYAPRFGGFVSAYNDHVAGLALDLERIER
ncbi:MAG: hypothetical protein ACI9TI_000449 [Natronomonas sp.]|jgi:hypothetical protein